MSTTTTQNYPPSLFSLNPGQTAYDTASTASSPRNSSPSPKLSPASTPPKRAPTDTSDFGSSSGINGKNESEASSLSSERDSGEGSHTCSHSSNIPDYTVPTVPLGAMLHGTGIPNPTYPISPLRWAPPNMAHPPPPVVGCAPSNVRVPPPPSYYTMTCPQAAETSSGSALRAANPGALANGPVNSNNNNPSNASHPASNLPNVPTQSGSPPLGLVVNSVPPPISGVAATTTQADNEIFVHVQPGETLILYVGNEPQNIAGPATIRMVCQNGPPTGPLPLHVPLGHCVQQFLDDKGNVKHIILSPQNSTSSRVPPTATYANIKNGTSSVRPNSVIPSTTPTTNTVKTALTTTTSTTTQNAEGSEQSSFNSLLRKKTHPKKPNAVAGTSHEANGTLPENDAIERYERERLQESLNRVVQPTVTRVGAFDVDVHWLEFDTSEATSSGGPFPHIDSSEFEYELFLYENAPNGRVFVTQTKCPPLSNHNGLNIKKLKPQTDYNVSVRASLPERQIFGRQSRTASFRTLPPPPDPPVMLRATYRGIYNISLAWSNAGGSYVASYILQMAKGKNEPYETVYEGPYDHARIAQLEPGTHYRARVAAQNETGQSEFSNTLHVNTNPPQPQVLPTTSANSNYYQQSIYRQSMGAGVHHNPPPYVPVIPKLQPPTVVFVSARQVKLTWQVSPEFGNVFLEISDSLRANPAFSPVPHESYQPANNTPCALVSNLRSNREYRFRLSGQILNGELIKSEAVSTRTHKDRYENSNYYERERVPPPTFQKAFEDESHAVELAWKHQIGDFDGVIFCVEGTVSYQKYENGEYCEYEWKVCYKGPNNYCTINDPSLNLFRVQALNRRGQSSPWSERAFVKRKPKRHANSQMIRQNHIYVNQQLYNHASTSTPKVVAPTPTPKPEPKEEPAKVLEPVKPPHCTQPTISDVTQNSMNISWTISDDSQLPEKKESLLFELQRVDKEPPVLVYSGDETKFNLENLRPVEHVQLRVRSVIVDNEGQRIKGEWSSIVSASTPCTVTSPPQNLRLKNEEQAFILIWDAPALTNGSAVIEYCVNSANFPEGHSDKNIRLQQLCNTDKTELVLEDLIPARVYFFNVVSRNEAGPSEPSNVFELTSPAVVPSTPQQVEVKALALESLSVTWLPAMKNGAEIEEYKVVLHQEKVLCSQQIVTGDVLEWTFDGLKPCTEYSIEVSARNSVGWGKPASKLGLTMDIPPEPPVLSAAQIAFNSLKLKWTTGASTSDNLETLYFYLEKESENGKFMAVYEGENRTAKVRGLKEASSHRFRIRASHVRGQPLLAGKWSKIYSFQTSALPPASIKNAPTVTEAGNNVYQMEWQPYKSLNGAEENVCYKLQVALKSSKGNEGWKTIYQGTSTAFTWTVSPAQATFTGTRQARVLVVQNKDGEEVHSLPSPVALFSSNRSPSDSPRKRPVKSTSGTSTPASTSSTRTRLNGSTPRIGPPVKLSLYKRLKRSITCFKRSITDSDWLIVVMTVFVVVALLIAVLVNSYYEK
ncbi:unnamed protein product [Bursaphelenchus xylophilus]|uniref:(pine wood nematode) hypothetical protein n=1 Tax=Bursaphelenchus xylophilus TaxID=6326 RepID=A0A1I7SLV7_BURXY|nr:unnamed protein product [Bursaphelenchus xylophilus]CAG9129872.1 unnamed protein product [Bursaphelenchus xylophilus]